MDVFLGYIAAFGFNYAPKGWVFCDGRLMSIAQNSALFSLLGTTYGGDGRTTFGIPDLRGRTLVGMGNGPGLSPIVQGELAGTQQITINSGNMPTHIHTLNAATLATSTTAAQGSSPGFLATTGATQIYAEDPNSSVAAIRGTTDAAGANQPLNILNPFLGINYSIAITGIFPSRN